MAFIYDLDNENGGQILSDSDTTGPALQINSRAAGYGAIAILSTASGSPIQAKTFAESSKFESVLTATDPALEVNSYAPGKDALSILSTASGYPINVNAINPTYGVRFVSSATIGNAVIIGRTVNGCVSIAPLKFLGTSNASGALMQFAGGFISCTSINYVAGGLLSDYAIPVVVGGEQRYIPLVQGSAVLGGAKFA